MANHEREPIVYELWSDDDLRWIEIRTPTIELAVFLEHWCEKNPSFFRRRPFRKHPGAPERAAALDVAVGDENRNRPS